MGRVLVVSPEARAKVAEVTELPRLPAAPAQMWPRPPPRPRASSHTTHFHTLMSPRMLTPSAMSPQPSSTAGTHPQQSLAPVWLTSHTFGSWCIKCVPA